MTDLLVSKGGGGGCWEREPGIAPVNGMLRDCGMPVDAAMSHPVDGGAYNDVMTGDRSKPTSKRTKNPNPV